MSKNILIEDMKQIDLQKTDRVILKTHMSYSDTHVWLLSILYENDTSWLGVFAITNEKLLPHDCENVIRNCAWSATWSQVKSQLCTYVVSIFWNSNNLTLTLHKYLQ